MKIRKIASLTAAVSFLVMILTSVILYIVPQGRVAYWADWRLWGLSKEQWGDIHINTGILFLISLGFHIYYNWRPLMAYLKDKAKNFKVFTKDFNVALILVLLVGAGTYFEIPPFSTILGISDHFKDAAAEKYGEPPYGHAELSSLKTFTEKMGLDLTESLKMLKGAGLTVSGEMQTLSDIGKFNNIPPQEVFLIIKPSLIKPSLIKSSEALEKVKKLPATPPPGTGNLTLADLCSQYNLNIKMVLRGLAKENIKASENLTIKKIATDNEISAPDIFERIKTIVADPEGQDSATG